MQLIYLIDVFQNSCNIVRDRFVTDSVNVIKNRLIVAKKQRKFQYILISLAHSIRKPRKLSLGTTILKSFVSHTGLRQTLEKLDDLQKYWADASCNL